MGLITQLVTIEDKENLWQPEVRHLHLWTTLRTRVFLHYIQREQNLQPGHAADGRLARLHPGLFKKHLQTLYHLMVRSAQLHYDALIFKKARDYSIYRYYYERIPDPLILDTSWKNNTSSHAWSTQNTVLTEKTASYSGEVHDRHVLVVSQGMLSDRLDSIMSALASTYPDYVFIYKLHPEEIGFPDRYTNLKPLRNVKLIDYQADIHSFIAEYQTIIGVMSTVLFEALAYSDQRIFILKNEFLDNQLAEKLGTIFTSTEDIIDLLSDSTQGHPQFDPARFWESDWKNRIDTFLEQYMTSR